MPGYKGETWNPVRGCTKVSPGCARCYAEAIDLRFKLGGGPFLPGKATITAREELLEIPLRWKAPRMVFTCSMSDLFHEEVSAEFIGRCFGVMAFASRHIFLVLTKRAERMHELLTRSEDFSNAMYHEYGRLAVQGGWDRVGSGWPAKNIWLGVSVENQHWADIRVPLLLATPATIRFLSLEPLLKAVNLSRYLDPLGHLDGMYRHQVRQGMFNEYQVGSLRRPTPDWVIVGGESGPGHRPMDPAWVSDIRDQCVAAGVPLFIKQDSGPKPGQQGQLSDDLWALKQFPVAAMP
jgi:protein gp37